VNYLGGSVVHDHLGLFDTPPDPGEIRLSLVVVGVLFALLLVILPLRAIQLAEVPAFIPVIDSIMLVGELITATLLYAQASVFRSRALTVLATGFLAAALLLIPHALTFPGAFGPHGLLGAGVNSTAWIASIRRAAFPISIILYVLVQRRESVTTAGMDRPGPSVAEGMVVGLVLALAVTVLATTGHELLPPYFIDRTRLSYSHALSYQFLLFVLFVIATAMLFRSRRSVLDMWLLVALAGWLAETMLVLTLQSRFTAGWYGLFFLTLLSHLVVMLALIAESNRLYARLALSTAAQRREREARVMSMEMVTAAIGHEVGQPLAAVSLNASAALSWLSKSRPDISKAMSSVRAISENSKRTFDVIKSIRTMFSKGPGPAIDFSINELVLETAAAMDRELASAKVVLDLGLDDSLPLIRADRVQIQRVLVNLVTNAIEALGPIRGRTRLISQTPTRRITIRSAISGGQEVQLDISDTGPGINDDELEQIFDPFYTTKASGTGLGLALCRSIVEDHRGRLWASGREESGATFHLTLPCRTMNPAKTADSYVSNP
jgi:signal transduction histidine kinase